VFRLDASGWTPTAISQATGISVSTIKRWLGRGPELILASALRRPTCDGSSDCSVVREAPHDHYAYLLGQYLGDGHVVRTANGVYRLEITCCATYTNIIEECAEAIARVLLFSLPFSSTAACDPAGRQLATGDRLQRLRRQAAKRGSSGRVRRTEVMNGVPGAGLEPARPFGQWILSPSRMPFRHPGSAGAAYLRPRVTRR
jgi:hypothetical protein